MKRTLKPVLSLLLTMTMVFSMLPMTTFATEGGQPPPIDTVATSPTTDGGLKLLGGEDDPDALLECICAHTRETKCNEDDRNQDCPVCINEPEYCLVGVESPEKQAMTPPATMAVTADYTLTFSGTGGELQKKDDASTKPFDKGTAYTVSGMEITLKDGFDFTSSAAIALELPAGTTLKVESGETATITGSGSQSVSTAGIESAGALTIAGGGTLNVTGGNTSSGNAIGIEVKANAALTVDMNGGTLNVTAGNTTASGNSEGFLGKTLNLTQGTVNFTAGNASSSSYGVFCVDSSNNSGAITITDGELNAKAGTGTNSYGIYLMSSSTLVMNGGEIYAEGNTTAMRGYGLTASGVSFRGKDASGDYSIFAGMDANLISKSAPYGAAVTEAKITKITNTQPLYFYVDSGSASLKLGTSNAYNAQTSLWSVSGSAPNFTLTLSDGFDFETTAADALVLYSNSDPINVIINVEGNAILSATGSGSEVRGGIYNCDAALLTIQGAGNLTVNGGSSTNNASSGIYAGNLAIDGGVTVTAIGGNGYSNSSYGVMTTGTLTIADGTLYGIGKANAISATDIADISSLILKEYVNGSYTGTARIEKPYNYRYHVVKDTATEVPNAKITDGAPPPPPPPPPVNPPSSGDSSKQDSTPAPNPWLEQSPAKNMSSQKENIANGFMRTKSADKYGVRKSSFAEIKGLRFEHDTVANGAVQVRLYINDTSKFKHDTLVSAYVSGAWVEMTKSKFEKHFENKIQVVHFDQQTAWDAPVRVAAKLDLSKMNVDSLYLYGYNKATNTYKRIAAPDYRIDKNGYLHFTTPFAGSVIISDKPLAKK